PLARLQFAIAAAARPPIRLREPLRIYFLLKQKDSTYACPHCWTVAVHFSIATSADGRDRKAFVCLRQRISRTAWFGRWRRTIRTRGGMAGFRAKQPNDTLASRTGYGIGLSFRTGWQDVDWISSCPGSGWNYAGSSLPWRRAGDIQRRDVRG